MACMYVDEDIAVSEDMEAVGTQVIDHYDAVPDHFLVRAIFRAMVHQMLVEHPELEQYLKPEPPQSPSFN